MGEVALTGWKGCTPKAQRRQGIAESEKWLLPFFIQVHTRILLSISFCVIPNLPSNTTLVFNVLRSGFTFCDGLSSPVRCIGNKITWNQEFLAVSIN
jgi:hypothetical protein